MVEPLLKWGMLLLTVSLVISWTTCSVIVDYLPGKTSAVSVGRCHVPLLSPYDGAMLGCRQPVYHGDASICSGAIRSELSRLCIVVKDRNRTVGARTIYINVCNLSVELEIR
jgi:hypothetical protein